ncbi:DUF721 domain-containing protein [Acinetobacter nectaris]|uniref:DUF721 domain-containing protein n=1 Tax=Acinetobacter nectaris TaxID=1219382 RepID=UPI001F23D512|nr:DUF721 domain-containing protein [Acinetobacter nectaris]MCF9046157.1 DUF721 domain-containing protein [Acinetobacter nectaris]
MSQPTKFFETANKKTNKSSNVKHLTQQVAYWQKLTNIIQPLLPQPENWQVACYQHGILTLTGENQAMISQLGYLQKNYVQKLSALDAFKDLERIHVRLRPKQNIPNAPKVSQPLPEETQNMLKSAASFVTDPKLSQALLNFVNQKK